MKSAAARENDPDATAQFDAFGKDSAQGKPAMFTDEEWAMLSDGPAPAQGGTGQGGTGQGGVAAGEAKTSAIKRQTSNLPEARTQVMQQRSPQAGYTPPAKPVVQHSFGFVDFLATAFITLAMPFMLLALAVRIASSGLFLKFEYFISPWFPEDSYGFTSDDRMHFGSYAVDFLFNGDTSRYLADVVDQNGQPVFTPGEVSHMADVKALVSLLIFIAIVGTIVSIIAAVYLGRKMGPGLHHALRWGGIFTLVAFAVLTVLGLLGWDKFFTSFHAIFFKNGTWEFFIDDALIRLFPPQFWIDAAVFVAGFVAVVSVLLILMSRIGHKQRRAARLAAKAARTS